MTYRGTAAAYDRFRPPYPAELIDDLRRQVPLGPGSRVLDLACATGQVAFSLAGIVGEVIAVDREPEFVDLARARVARLDATNVDLICADAETVELDGEFDLVAIGNAFHRLDREATLANVVPHVGSGGCVALLWGDTPWVGDQPWQVAMAEILGRWREIVDAPAGRTESVTAHVDALAAAGLTVEGRTEFTTSQRWSIESLAGFVASTSFLNHLVLGDRVEDFERDLADALRTVQPDGVFEPVLSWALDLARR